MHKKGVAKLFMSYPLVLWTLYFRTIVILIFILLGQNEKYVGDVSCTYLLFVQSNAL